MHSINSRDERTEDGAHDGSHGGSAGRKKAALRARYGLTAREAELALCLADGLSYGEIAEHLNLSPHTVSSHVKSILSKTQAGSSRKLAALIAKL